MISITIPVSSSLDYRVPSLALPRQTVSIKIDFQNGDHTFTSEKFTLGTVHSAESRTLYGQIAFRYSYQDTERILTVCGSDYSSNDTMILVTNPDGLDDICVERTTGSYSHPEIASNRYWNSRSVLVPGASTVFRNVVREANNVMIQALKETEGLILRVRTPIPSNLTGEDYLALCTVHRRGEFLGMYDPSKEYGDDVTIGNFESTWGGTVHMHWGENFANVIGSTTDPHIAGKSWIRLWADQFGAYPTACTSYNYNGFICGNTFVGGHVVLGQIAKVVADWSNNVYIMPICHAHNNNDHVYMAAVRYKDGVWLNNYLH